MDSAAFTFSGPGWLTDLLIKGLRSDEQKGFLSGTNRADMLGRFHWGSCGNTMSSIPVHVGAWTGWSRNAVLGSSLTVPDKYGKIILSSTATFISAIVANAAWQFAAYFMHRYLPRINDQVPRGLHYQHQVAIRNSQTPLSTFMEVLSTCKAWSGSSWWSVCLKIYNYNASKEDDDKDEAPPCYQGIWRQTALVMFLVGSVWAFFTGCGVVSSYVAVPATKASSVEVKHQDQLCGTRTFDTSSEAGKIAAQWKALNDTIAARAYARSCYAADLGSPNTITCSLLRQAFSRLRHGRSRGQVSVWFRAVSRQPRSSFCWGGVRYYCERWALLAVHQLP